MYLSNIIGGSKNIMKTFTYPCVMLLTYLAWWNVDTKNPANKPTNIEKVDSFRNFIFIFVIKMFPNIDAPSKPITINISLIKYNS